MEIVQNGNCEFVARDDGTYIVYEKIRTEDNRLKPYRTFIQDSGTTADGTKEVKALFSDKKIFDFPKPIKLIQHLEPVHTNASTIMANKMKPAKTMSSLS